MNENYIVINGNRVELTEKQLKMLGVEIERKNPFERVANGDKYFYIDKHSSTQSWEEDHDGSDDSLVDCCNYFNDEDFARQVALRQLLYRKLLKYSYNNEFEDEEWDGNNMHAYIIYNFTRKDYDIRWTRDEKEPGTVYFKSPTRATAALNGVVMPFVKEHPDFVW